MKLTGRPPEVVIGRSFDSKVEELGYVTDWIINHSICFSINLLVFYQECRSLIGYATRYLFCDR